jgi:hypothetical protein
MSIIKKCPFCGSNGKIDTDKWPIDFEDGKYQSQVVCIICRSFGPSHMSQYKDLAENEAIRLWNKRV